MYVSEVVTGVTVAYWVAARAPGRWV